jgi:hypothetical protein
MTALLVQAAFALGYAGVLAGVLLVCLEAGFGIALGREELAA